MAATRCTWEYVLDVLLVGFLAHCPLEKDLLEAAGGVFDREYLATACNRK